MSTVTANPTSLNELLTKAETATERTNVYEAISRVQADLAKVGIAKDQSNAQQGYKFRGIDDLYNTLSRLLSNHGLVIIPKVTNRLVTERTTAKGGVLLYVVVTVEYALISARDGSQHVATVVGEAMDSGDKATNKAMSAAYKYLCLQTFCIPTEGDNDADATTHEVAPRKSTSVASMVLDGVDRAPEPIIDEAEMAMRKALNKLADGVIDFEEAKGERNDILFSFSAEEKIQLWQRFDAGERKAIKNLKLDW